MKYDSQINSLIQEIAGLCYQIKCAHEIDVFFDWSAHINSITVQVFDGRWSKDKRHKWQAWISLTCADEVDVPLEQLVGLRDRLAKTLRNGAIK